MLFPLITYENVKSILFRNIYFCFFVFIASEQKRYIHQACMVAPLIESVYL